MEIEDCSVDVALGGTASQDTVRFERMDYFRDLFRLQRELVKLQDWVAHQR